MPSDGWLTPPPPLHTQAQRPIFSPDFHTSLEQMASLGTLSDCVEACVLRRSPVGDEFLFFIVGGMSPGLWSVGTSTHPTTSMAQSQGHYRIVENHVYFVLENAMLLLISQALFHMQNGWLNRKDLHRQLKSLLATIHNYKNGSHNTPAVSPRLVPRQSFSEEEHRESGGGGGLCFIPDAMLTTARLPYTAAVLRLAQNLLQELE